MRPDSASSSLMNARSMQDLKPEKFLKTKLNEYLTCKGDRCISCSECMKHQDKNLFYKYPPKMSSHYMAEFSTMNNSGKANEFNLDKEKLKCKIPYKVPRDFVSSH
jgi:hypothetical protein